jgi:hypothetical protein
VGEVSRGSLVAIVAVAGAAATRPLWLSALQVGKVGGCWGLCWHVLVCSGAGHVVRLAED